jgi:hypothetical protein
MINIIDNFLDEGVYEFIYDDLKSKEFSKIDVGDKSFWVQPSTPEFENIVIELINSIENKNRRSILSFFRIATDKVDTNWNIHSDSIIDGERPERALVLYLSPSEMSGLHGTAFWKHKELGDCLPPNVSFDRFDDVLAGESSGVDNWDLQTVVGYKVNRAVTYPCNYFHSKYPNVGWESGRIVYVMFYK